MLAAVIDVALIAWSAIALRASLQLPAAGFERPEKIACWLLIPGILGAGLVGVFDAAMLLFGAEQSATPIADMDPAPLLLLLSLVVATSGALVLTRAAELNFRRRVDVAEGNAAESRRRETAARRSVEALCGLSDRALFCFELNPPVRASLPVAEQVRRSYDAVLLDCNEAMVDLLSADARGDVIGIRLGDTAIASDSSSHDRLVADFVRSGYELPRYEHAYTDRWGSNRSVVLTLSGVVEDGCVSCVWGSLDRGDAKRADEAMARRNDDVQETIARVSSRLLTSGHDGIEDAVTASLRDVCRFVKADRAAIGWFDLSSGSVDVLYQWVENGPAATPSVSRDELRWMYPLIKSGESVGFSSVDELPDSARADRQALRNMGIQSAIVSPIIVEGETLGALSLANTETEQIWSHMHYRSLRVIAASFGSAIRRLRADRRMNELMRELAEARDRLEAENVYLQQEIISGHGFDEVIGESSALRLCLDQVARVAQTTAPVLLHGETGTGKELLARAIHQRSKRSDRPLVKVNCAALPPSLIESELFGHEKGAFTGALASKPGRFDLADGGTIFLDEIGDLSQGLQAKLLRVLQEGEFQRVGGTTTTNVDVRLIAATNRNLLEAIDEGRFRADLYYRINTFTIEVPPLRERKGDIPLLARHFVTKHAQRLGKRFDAIALTALEELEAHDWPGNVRELESVIQRAMITARGPLLQLAGGLRTPARAINSEVAEPETPARPRDLRSAEIAHITEVLEQCAWKITGQEGAAEKLGLPPSTLRSRMQKYGISRPELRV